MLKSVVDNPETSVGMNNGKLYLEKHTREVNFCHEGYSVNRAKFKFSAYSD